MKNNLTILFEDTHILVCIKPAGVPSQSGRSLDPDMVNQLKNYLFHNSLDKKPPYLGLIHRLDQPVEGIMVFAKTPFAAKNLSEQVQLKTMKKNYLAVLTADLTNELKNGETKLEDYLIKNGVTNLSSIVPANASTNTKDAKKAILTYQVKEVLHSSQLTENNNNLDTPLTLLDINLETGRHHQIRVQMAAHKGGLWGDTKYNKQFTNQTGWHQIALYAYKLAFKHPKTKKQLEFTHYPEQNPFQYFTYLKDKKN